MFTDCATKIGIQWLRILIFWAQLLSFLCLLCCTTVTGDQIFGCRIQY